MNKVRNAVLALGLVAVSVMLLDDAAMGQSRGPRDGVRGRVDGTRFKIEHQDRWRGQFPPNRQECQSTSYSPVCARTRNYVVTTYSNRCFAEIDGAVVISRDGTPCPPKNCNTLYLPVCARINRPDDDPLKPREIKAFINSCMAKEYKGEAWNGSGWDDPDGGISTTILRTFDDDIYSVPAHAYSRKPDTADEFDRVCPASADACPQKPDYVCARDANNIARIYRNKCYAVLDGAVYMWHMSPKAEPCR